MPDTRDKDSPENQKSSDARHTGKRDLDRTIFHMPKLPELMIGYGPDHFPIGAVCSCCGAGMPRPESALLTAAEVIDWFSQAFATHKEMKHPQPVTADTPSKEDLLLN
jgi:hypothetical protein